MICLAIWANWLIAILVILALLAIFIVSFILYRRTPVPKGCEGLEPDVSKCAGCGESACRFYQKKEESEK